MVQVRRVYTLSSLPGAWNQAFLAGLRKGFLTAVITWPHKEPLRTPGMKFHYVMRGKVMLCIILLRTNDRIHASRMNTLLATEGVINHTVGTFVINNSTLVVFCTQSQTHFGKRWFWFVLKLLFNIDISNKLKYVSPRNRLHVFFMSIECSLTHLKIPGFRGIRKM